LKKIKITGMPVDFEHRLRTKDLLEFKNTPIIESTTDILSIGKPFHLNSKFDCTTYIVCRANNLRNLLSKLHIIAD
jgi:hypothetical protein